MMLKLWNGNVLEVNSLKKKYNIKSSLKNVYAVTEESDISTSGDELEKLKQSILLTDDDAGHDEEEEEDNLTKDNITEDDKHKLVREWFGDIDLRSIADISDYFTDGVFNMQYESTLEQAPYSERLNWSSRSRGSELCYVSRTVSLQLFPARSTVRPCI